MKKVKHYVEKNILRWLFIGCLILLIGGFIPVSHSALNRVIQNSVRLAVPKATVHLSRGTIALWRGVSVHALEIHARTGTMNHTLVLDKVTLRWHLPTSFIHAWSIVSSLRAVRQDGSPRTREKLLRALQPSIKKVSFVNGNYKGIDTLSTDTLYAQKLRGQIGFASSGKNDLRLKLDAAQWGFHRVDMTGLSASVLIHDGYVTIQSCSADLYGGTVDAIATIHPRSRHILSGRVDARKVDLEQFYSSRPHAAGSLSGEGAFKIAFHESFLSVQNIRGDGTFSITNCVADEIPLLTNLVVAVAVPRLERCRFETLDGRFAFGEEHVVCSTIVGHGTPVDITAQGTITYPGYMRMDMEGLFDSQWEDSVSALTWQSLLPADDRARKFICTVNGTFYNPVVRFDAVHTRRAVRSVFTTMRKNFRSAFGSD